MAGQASAQQMAGLDFETGQIDTALADALREDVATVFQGVNNWSFIDFEAARGRMNPVTRDCFTADCLTKAGTAVGAPAGLRVEMSGEAEIYDWTIDVYDLRSGEKLKTETGTCELCGHTEVRRTFRSSLETALTGTTLAGQADASQADAGQATGNDSAAQGTPEGPVQLRISTEPQDTKIYLNDQLAGEGQVTRSVGAGEHQVRFQREGYRGFVETIVVNDETDGPVILHVHLSRTDPEAVEVATGVGPIDRLEDRDTYGWVGVGTGAAVLGIGMYLTAIDGETACDDSVPFAQCEEVYATGGAGLTMGMLGTGLITSGVVLLTWEHLAGDTGRTADDDGEPVPTDEVDEEPAEISLTPSVGPDGGGLFLRGTF